MKKQNKYFYSGNPASLSNRVSHKQRKLKIRLQRGNWWRLKRIATHIGISFSRTPTGTRCMRHLAKSIQIADSSKKSPSCRGIPTDCNSIRISTTKPKTRCNETARRWNSSPGSMSKGILEILNKICLMLFSISDFHKIINNTNLIIFQI